MKRSEMVKLIAERFRENGVRPTRVCIEEAEYLLDNIEEAGMLPPPPEGVHESNAYNFMYKWDED